MIKHHNIHFAHANGVPAGTYQPLFARLSQSEVLCLPMIAHEPKTEIGDNWELLAEELILYLEKNTASPVVGVGHSLGAIVTFIAAHKRPDLFHSVLMLDPPILFGLSAMWFKILKMIYPGLIDKITPAGRTRTRVRSWENLDAAVSYLSNKPFYRSFSDECFESFIQYGLRQVSTGVELAFDVELETEIFRNIPHNLAKYSSPCNMKTQLVFATKTTDSKRRSVENFTKKLGIDLIIINGEHMFPLQDPDLAAKVINAFIE